MKKCILPLVLFVVCAALLMTFIGIGNSSLPEAQAEVQLPADGVVGDNLLLNSSSFTSLDYWYAGGASWFTYSNGKLVVSSSSSQKYPFNYSLGECPSDTVLTFSVYVSAISGVSYIWLRNVTNTQLGSNILSLGLNTCSFRITATGIPQAAFSIPASSTLTIDWVKVETGSDFTGFVPNNYTNYGYNQGRTDGIAVGEDTVYGTNKGWSKYDVFRDFKTDDTYLNNLSSSNGGTISYVSSSGMNLTSPANGTSFLINTGSVSLSSNNMTLTLALGYIGTFTKGDVVLSFDYSYYTGISSNPPWNGINPVNTSFSYSLDPGDIFVTTLYPIRDVPSRLTLTIRSGTNFTLQAFKVESGSIFTMFPIGASVEASFNNGYDSGLSVGLDQGYDTGYTQGYNLGNEEGITVGYDQGFSVGRNEGYSLGLQTAQNGSFFALFSSLIDVPVSALISLLDYDFFGINLWNFARFLLTLTLFFAVLHLFTKGKLKA